MLTSFGSETVHHAVSCRKCWQSCLHRVSKNWLCFYFFGI